MAERPGTVLRREIEARGWTQKQLAALIGRPPQAVNEIVVGKKAITPETALDLEAAFGEDLPAEYWLRLEWGHRLERARRKRRGKGEGMRMDTTATRGQGGPERLRSVRLVADTEEDERRLGRLESAVREGKLWSRLDLPGDGGSDRTEGEG